MRKKKSPPPPPRIPTEALAWSSEITPDVAPPQSGLAKGFLHNSYAVRVEKACTGPVSHNFGGDDRTTTQGARFLFSTRLRAAMAMRYEVEVECAWKLHRIDEMIEKERLDAAPSEGEKK